MNASVRPEATSGSGAPLLRPLPWQQELWIELTTQVLQQRLSHALLLSGPAGVGKRWLARALVAFLICEQRSGYACGQCRSCQQLAAGTQPNAAVLGTDGHVALALADAPPETALVHWEPDKDSKRRDIAIAAVQSVIAQLQQASHYGQARAVLVDPADRLNDSSVNALLKLVEEPPAGTHLIFISERPQALAATLRSRCQRVRLPVPDAAAAASWLAAQTGRPDHAEALAAAHGAPLRALQFAEGDALALRREWAELWQAVARRRKDPVSAAATIDRDSVAAHLQWAWSWLHAQFRERALAGALDADAAAAWDELLAEIVEANRLAAGTAQPQLLLESLLVLWLKHAARALGAR